MIVTLCLHFQLGSVPRASQCNSILLLRQMVKAEVHQGLETHNRVIPVVSGEVDIFYYLHSMSHIFPAL